jgi:hypothetical protein
VIGADAFGGEFQRGAILGRDTFAHSASISSGVKASVSGVSVSRSKRAVSSISAASPRARTSAMIAATASSTSAASSRLAPSKGGKGGLETGIGGGQVCGHGGVLSPDCIAKGTGGLKRW